MMQTVINNAVLVFIAHTSEPKIVHATVRGGVTAGGYTVINNPFQIYCFTTSGSWTRSLFESLTGTPS